jgi:hypothetical protein
VCSLCECVHVLVRIERVFGRFLTGLVGFYSRLVWSGFDSRLGWSGLIVD